VVWLRAGDLDKFKAAVKEAVDEFLASADSAEFEETVKELRMPIYHQVTRLRVRIRSAPFGADRRSVIGVCRSWLKS
jgi:hypothetical protein